MSFAASHQALQPLPTDIELVEALKRAGFDTYCMVADSVFSSVDQYLSDKQHEGLFYRWVVPSERSIPAVAAGRWLATGKPTIMLMQNSGFSNAMDYLRTVLLVHHVPGLVVSGWRGYDAMIDDSEPHVLVGQCSESDAINTLGKEHVFGQINGNNLLEHVQNAMNDVLNGHVACLNISPQGFKKTYPLRSVANKDIPSINMDNYSRITKVKGRSYHEVMKDALISRADALQKIHHEMEPKHPFYIIGNGFNPRAMQALRISKNTFENAGGMGSSLAMAWGAAKSNPHQIFVAIDGDQNAVMNEMEKVLCSDYPENLYWYIINNGTGESVGTSLSLPLAPWHYELARVINTFNEAPDTFNYPRINASGLKFETPEAQELALRIGNLPAQAALAREILAQTNPIKIL